MENNIEHYFVTLSKDSSMSYKIRRRNFGKHYNIESNKNLFKHFFIFIAVFVYIFPICNGCSSRPKPKPIPPITTSTTTTTTITPSPKSNILTELRPSSTVSFISRPVVGYKINHQQFNRQNGGGYKIGPPLGIRLGGTSTTIDYLSSTLTTAKSSSISSVPQLPSTTPTPSSSSVPQPPSHPPSRSIPSSMLLERSDTHNSNEIIFGTTSRPNVTFYTDSCPPMYSSWYCLNGATCFIIKIGEHTLYNCECSEGFMGPRCDFKDLDSSYLLSRKQILFETASIAIGATLAILLVVIVCASLFIRYNRISLQRQYFHYDRFY